MRTHNIMFQVLAACKRQYYFTFGIHNINRGYGGKTVVFGRLAMRFCVGTTSTVCCVALDNRSIYFLY